MFKTNISQPLASQYRCKRIQHFTLLLSFPQLGLQGILKRTSNGCNMYKHAISHANLSLRYFFFCIDCFIYSFIHSVAVDLVGRHKSNLPLGWSENAFWVWNLIHTDPLHCCCLPPLKGLWVPTPERRHFWLLSSPLGAVLNRRLCLGWGFAKWVGNVGGCGGVLNEQGIGETPSLVQTSSSSWKKTKEWRGRRMELLVGSAATAAGAATRLTLADHHPHRISSSPCAVSLEARSLRDLTLNSSSVSVLSHWSLCYCCCSSSSSALLANVGQRFLGKKKGVAVQFFWLHCCCIWSENHCTLLSLSRGPCIQSVCSASCTFAIPCRRLVLNSI